LRIFGRPPLNEHWLPCSPWHDIDLWHAPENEQDKRNILKQISPDSVTELLPETKEDTKISVKLREVLEINGASEGLGVDDHPTVAAGVVLDTRLPEVTCVIEIPKGSNAKMEVDTTCELNAIQQDRNKDGSLRFFKAGPIPFNYGMLPQTWESPLHMDKALGAPGDNDPLDVVDLAPQALAVGGIYHLKVLGALGVIDGGESDWKIIGINSGIPEAAKINTLKDIENTWPGTLEKVRDWFENYKIPEGKGRLKIAYGGICVPPVCV
ncbi:MAG: hypothetical protein MHM6MM_009301, partial [Cercozoa sp. M6MM]